MSRAQPARSTQQLLLRHRPPSTTVYSVFSLSFSHTRKHFVVGPHVHASNYNLSTHARTEHEGIERLIEKRERERERDGERKTAQTTYIILYIFFAQMTFFSSPFSLTRRPTTVLLLSLACSRDFDTPRRVTCYGVVVQHRSEDDGDGEVCYNIQWRA